MIYIHILKDLRVVKLIDKRPLSAIRVDKCFRSNIRSFTGYQEKCFELGQINSGSWKLEHAVTQRNHYGCSYSLLSAKGGRTGAIKGTLCTCAFGTETPRVTPCFAMCHDV